MSLTSQEQTALAVLRTGGSYADAMTFGVSFQRLQEIWAQQKDQK